MHLTQISQTVSFIWGIADAVLRTYKPGTNTGKADGCYALFVIKL